MKSQLSAEEKISLFADLFKGRTDVFAMRWEKADKSASGYTPFCLNEWKRGICIKLQRGRCKDCGHKNYTGLSETYIEQHLRGKQTFGIYPLLPDNTSFFLAADFDGDGWQEDAVSFIKVCHLHKLPAYLERSRSGKGGHVWLFFAEKYPAFKSRKIIFSLLREAEIIDTFEKDESFDRLFPNQDYLGSTGIGNLIALPLQGRSRKEQNSVFLNLKNNMIPFKDQWHFLSKIKKIDTSQLDKLFEVFTKKREFDNATSKALSIKLKEQIYLSKANLPDLIINFLREKLNFANAEYIIKKRMGLNIYGIEKYFKLLESKSDHIRVPRGFLNELIEFCDKNKINYSIEDLRYKSKEKNLRAQFRLYDYQSEAVSKLLEHENGILVAPPGAGKTIIGIQLITEIEQSTLIIVHKRQIFDQWVDRIENFLGIPKRQLGMFVSGKKKIGDSITIAMIQTLDRLDDFESLQNQFGLILVDECHHVPAKMFRRVITKFNSHYLYGFTATPQRKYNDEKLIYYYLGQIIHRIPSHYQHSQPTLDAVQVKVQNTELSIPFSFQVDDFHLLSKVLIFDTHRNQQIINDLKAVLTQEQKVLVLSERKEHLEVLNYYLKIDIETIILSGDMKISQRKNKVKQIKEGHFQVLFATGQMVGEGTDFDNLDALFLVFPFAFEGKLIQYIGRIQRGESHQKVIYDYRDVKVKFLENMYKKRLRYYKKNFNVHVNEI